MTRQHSQTFYLGSLFFPAPQRPAVWAVYAACRQVDDMVDEPGADPAAEVERWWARVKRAFDGQAAEDDAVGQGLAWAAGRYPLTLDAFADLREGMRMDLAMDAQGTRYETLEQLDRYCYCVGGVIGLMIAPISGYGGEQCTIDRALRLGRAMQLTNILRDVGEDWERGRLYLPQDLMREYGVTEADIAAGRVTPSYRALLAQLAARARADYAAGRAGIPQLHGRARWAVAVAADLYEGILDELERSGYDNLTRRAVVGRGRKLGLTARAALRETMPHCSVFGRKSDLPSSA
ncbi:phytoene/squalene synthase family protein [Deinococcus radiophilus]|uniref:Phytoene/squalene synthase family protein n=2 Tax=Deinococcus radiophilus TaxID=32062 RepID=A0A3S0I4M3_9DEIO|nr:phytoene/squalene synthase family protein [Deinococcus radiophilus]RTR27308.1 phytoene/squalene synthase family protein [Deinococcus radiophilus]UFA50648.1 phytoene/squalene synthase family protein [Deinococcus radiophilus]